MVLLVALSAIDNRNTRLAAENTQMKGRLEWLQEKRQRPANEPLNVERVADAVRYVGFVPEINENGVFFMIRGETFFIDTSRLPQIFVILQFSINTGEYDMDLLKHAAHVMSDSLLMVKATFSDADELGKIGLCFFVAAMDRDYFNFKGNLLEYINIIEHGCRVMGESYENLVKEKRDAALTISPFSPAEPQKIIMS